MKDFNQKHSTFIRVMLILLTILFFYLIRSFILPLILAIVFAALLTPVYNWLNSKLKQKTTLSAVLTVLFFIAIVVIPSIFLIQNIASQAVDVTEKLMPYIQKQIGSGELTDTNKDLPEWFPFRNYLEPYKADIYAKLSNLIGNFGNIVIQGLSSATAGTFTAILNFFIMIYAIFSFLTDGKSIMESLQKYLPLSKDDFHQIKEEFIGISKATIKGAFLIALIQGILVGIGFYFAGIQGSLFWATVATFASLIPSLGAGLIYIPGCIYLFVNGHQPEAIGLLLWGVGIVSTIDNILRPRLVGKEMQMSDLSVLVSTLGGISMFGISGIVLGPMVVGLLTTFIKISYNTEEN